MRSTFFGLELLFDKVSALPCLTSSPTSRLNPSDLVTFDFWNAIKLVTTPKGFQGVQKVYKWIHKDVLVSPEGYSFVNGTTVKGYARKWATPLPQSVYTP